MRYYTITNPNIKINKLFFTSIENAQKFIDNNHNALKNYLSDNECDIEDYNKIDFLGIITNPVFNIDDSVKENRLKLDKNDKTASRLYFDENNNHPNAKYNESIRLAISTYINNYTKFKIIPTCDIKINDNEEPLMIADDRNYSSDLLDNYLSMVLHKLIVGKVKIESIQVNGIEIENEIYVDNMFNSHNSDLKTLLPFEEVMNILASSQHYLAKYPDVLKSAVLHHALHMAHSAISDLQDLKSSLKNLLPRS